SRPGRSPGAPASRRCRVRSCGARRCPTESRRRCWWHPAQPHGNATAKGRLWSAQWREYPRESPFPSDKKGFDSPVLARSASGSIASNSARKRANVGVTWADGRWIIFQRNFRLVGGLALRIFMAMNLHSLIASAQQQGASDLHLEAGLPPAVRVRGSLRMTGEPVAAKTLLEWAR